MKTEHKSFAAPECKVVDDSQGIIEAIVSVFNNVDYGKDRIRPGFFAKSLDRKLPKGVWGHDWMMPVAKTLEARELRPGDPKLPPSLRPLGGLYIKGQFNLNTQRGREAYEDIKFGAIDEFSIGYKVAKSETDEKTGIRELIEGDVFEWSPVLVGMNNRTQLLSVKSDDPVPANDRAAVLSSKAATMAVAIGDDNGPLGDAGRAMAYAAMGRLHDLLCMTLFSVLWNDTAPLGERLRLIGEACDQFRSVLLRMLSLLLAMGAADGDGEPAVPTDGIETSAAGDGPDSPGGDTPRPEPADIKSTIETMYRQYRERFGLPVDDDFAAKLDSAPDGGLAAHARAVVSAVEGFFARARERAEFRSKFGRKLSPANRESIASASDAADSLAAHLAGLLGPDRPDDAKDAATTTPVEAGPPTEAEAAPDSESPPAEDAAGAPDGDSAKSTPLDPSEVDALFTRFLDTIEAPRWG